MDDEQNLPTGKPLSICTIGNRVLRAKTKIITDFDELLSEFLERMLACMYENHGVGLAAPQVGCSKKICVIDVSPCLSEDDTCTLDGKIVKNIADIMPLFLVNPAVTKKSADMIEQEEGCLSVPDFSARVRRPQEVTVQYVDPAQKQHTITANAILARCMQHEIDHLNGRLYTDLITKEDKARLARYLSTHPQQ